MYATLRRGDEANRTSPFTSVFLVVTRRHVVDPARRSNNETGMPTTTFFDTASTSRPRNVILLPRRIRAADALNARRVPRGLAGTDIRYVFVQELDMPRESMTVALNVP